MSRSLGTWVVFSNAFWIFLSKTNNFSILKSVCWFGLIPQSKLGDLHFSLTVFKEEVCFYVNLFPQVF